MRPAPIIVAHRGLHDAHPENSIEAFRAASRAGIEWGELDVQVSRDGYPVVIHDDLLDRTTTSSGPVAARFADILRRTRLRSANGSASGSFLPVMRERAGLSAILSLRVSMLIEIKPPDAPRLVQRVAEAMRRHARPWVIQSFDAANLAHAKRYVPRVPRALLVERAADLTDAVANTNHPLNVHHALVTDALVRRMHDERRTIGAWTVNGEGRIRRVAELGVDVIITDEPLLAREVTLSLPEISR